MVKELIIPLIMTVVRLLVSVVLSAGSLYIGMNILDSLTSGIEEWKEIKKGNVAVGIFYAVVLVSLIVLVAPRIEDLIFWVRVSASWQETLFALAISFVNYILALLMSILVLYLAINVIDRLTADLNEMEALKAGNIAVALVFSAMVLGIVIVARVPMETLFVVIKNLEATLLGFAV